MTNPVSKSDFLEARKEFDSAVKKLLEEQGDLFTRIRTEIERAQITAIIKDDPVSHE